MKANRFDTISIQIIPEPAAVYFVGIISIAVLGGRHRRKA